MKKRGQVSVELVLTVAFALLIITPLVIILYGHTTNSKQEIDNNQAGLIARKITDSADSVYYLGYPSAVTLKVYMPEHISVINISGREITIEFVSGVEATSVAVVNLTGYLSPSSGVRHIKISALENMVNISEDVN